MLRFGGRTFEVLQGVPQSEAHVVTTRAQRQVQHAAETRLHEWNFPDRSVLEQVLLDPLRWVQEPHAAWVPGVRGGRQQLRRVKQTIHTAKEKNVSETERWLVVNRGISFVRWSRKTAQNRRGRGAGVKCRVGEEPCTHPVRLHNVSWGYPRSARTAWRSRLRKRRKKALDAKHQARVYFFLRQALFFTLDAVTRLFFINTQHVRRKRLDTPGITARPVIPLPQAHPPRSQTTHNPLSHVRTIAHILRVKTSDAVSQQHAPVARNGSGTW